MVEPGVAAATTSGGARRRSGGGEKSEADCVKASQLFGEAREIY